MTRLLRALRRGADDGMSTAEYCIGVVAACAFAGVLYKVLTGDPVHRLLTSAFSHALSLAGL